ncbi:MAG: hypothetical protein WAW53_04135 [Candidatus Dormiibacterota bacterium]
MDLRPYIEDIQQQLADAAEAAGDEARAVAERLAAPLSAAIRLALQDALTVAAEEITVDLAPGSVELRLHGRDIDFVVTHPPADVASADTAGAEVPTHAWTARPSTDVDDAEGGMSRINLRLPEQLKVRIERAAGTEGLSVNAWLVRVVGARVDGADPGRQQETRVAHSGNRYTGWVR